MRNLLTLLPHMLPNVRGYRCISKKIAEEPLFKYIILQKQSRALSLALLEVLSEANQSKKELLQLAMIDAASFQYLAR